MKSRTSSCNKTVFKKDLTRFAPAWGAFLIFMLLAVISIGNDRFAFYRLQSIRDCITAFAWLNLIYAAVTAQLIFGDLYNSRMCNAQHALPLRRECWFGTHVAAGLAFSLIPSVLVTLIGLPVLRLEAGWSAAFWWLLGTQLQYLFFFGIAVLCVMLTGNRLGQIALYGMINFGGLLAYWFASAVYQPFLHGVQFPEDPFMLLCPLAQISSATHDVLLIDHQEVVNAFGELETYLIYSVKPGNGWGYLTICAGAGVLALAAALVLYRRRKIECAGDFVAFAAMEPVVTVIVTVFTGGVFHLFADNFGMNLRSVMLGAGMVVGFFACRMLLERTTRVFRKKAFLFCGSIVAVFGLTVLLTYLDPVGITRYVPAAEEIESVTFGQGYNLHSYSNFPYTATDPEEIAQLQQVHRLGIAKQSDVQPGGTEEVYSTFDLRIEYKLKNGRTVNRFYGVQPQAEAGQILKDYLTRTECVAGVPEQQLQSLAPYIRSVYTQGREGKEMDIGDLDIEGMLAAIAADCAAGNMAQINSYHYPSNYDLLGYENIDDIVAYLELGFDRQLLEKDMVNEYYGTVSYLRYIHIRVYASCENTLRWMAENELLTEESQRETIEKFYGAYAGFETVRVS